MVSSETVKLYCSSMDPDEADWEGELYFDTDSKSAAYQFWPWEPAIAWSDDVIIWSSYSKDPYHLAGLFYYDRNEDILQVMTISDKDISMYNLKYGQERTVYPKRCRRRSF